MKAKEALDFLYEAEDAVEKITKGDFTAKTKRMVLESLKETIEAELEDLISQSQTEN